MNTYYFTVENNTKPEDLDLYFQILWNLKPSKNSLHLVIDVTQCQLTLSRALSIQGVLNKHRAQSKQYIHHSTILVTSKVVKNILNTVLFIVRPERPVIVTTPLPV